MFPAIVCKNDSKKLLDYLLSIDSKSNTATDTRVLDKIEQVDFSHSEMECLPESIGLLRNLQKLDLQFNKLKYLPEAICSLAKLERLVLNNNQLRCLPDMFYMLSELIELNLDWNMIEYLPEQFGKLQKISMLSIIGNRLFTLPHSFYQLNALKVLDIQSNNIIALPDSFGELQLLETLDMSENPMSIFPLSICSLRSIKRLGISRMNLHSFPREILNLNLSFRDNVLFDVSNPEGIYLHGSILETQPISLFTQERSLIKAYYEQEMVRVKEAKVLFLGEGSVGKTYTIKRLLFGGRLETSTNSHEYTTTETHGIIISNYVSNKYDIRIKFWDFGGQEILHSMHRCFLSDRSCYVVVVGTRTQDPMGQARRWLRCIQTLAPASPVILLVNRFSNFGCTGLDELGLKREFIQLQRVRYFSSKTASKEEFMLLEEDIAKISSELSGCGLSLPLNWNLVKEELTRRAEVEHQFYIKNEVYFQICEDNGLPAKNAVTPNGDLRLWLLDWFNDLGVCFSNHKGGRGDFAVLNPEWLTNALYLIIYKGKEYTNTGIIAHKAIQMILMHPEDGESGDVPFLSNVSYGHNEYKFILDIMRNFELSYIEDNKNEFIPALAMEQRPSEDYLIPSTWNSQSESHEHFTYEFRYDYFTNVVLHRLMIICRNILKWNISPCWALGMRIDNVPDHQTAIVEPRANESLIIDIFAYGSEPGWKLLQVLIQPVLEINQDLNLKAVEYLTVNGSNCKDSFKVEWLIKQKNRGHELVYGEDDTYRIDDLLGKIYGKDNLLQAIKISKNSNSSLEIAGLNHIAAKNTSNYYYYVSAYATRNSFTNNKSSPVLAEFTNEDLIEYTNNLPNRERVVPESFLNILAERCRTEANRYTGLSKTTFIRLADQITEKNVPKQIRLRKLSDWINDAANVAVIDPHDSTPAMLLFEFLKKIFPVIISQFPSMLQFLKQQ